MLHLSRRSGEKLIFETENGTIRMSFYIKDGQVKLGIRAPQSVNIIRAELLKNEKHSDSQEYDD